MAHRTAHATRAINKNGTGKDGFTEGQTSPTPIAATVVTEDVLNMLQEEIVGTVEAAGLTPTPGSFSQLVAAIRRIFGMCALATWNLITSPTTDSLNDVHWDGTYFVAVGAAGRIIHSFNTIVWTSLTAGAAAFNGVTKGSTLWVAVGVGGVIYTSPDRSTWTSRTSGTANDLYQVRWNGSLFVAVGASGTIITSPDGITWTTRTSGTSNLLLGLCWNGALWIAAGATGTILTSPDAITWTTRTSGTTQFLSDVAWNGTRLVAVGTGGTVATSTDGITWAVQASLTLVDLAEVAWNGYAFCIVGDQVIFTSPDGVTWTPRPTESTPFYMLAIAWGGGAPAAAGYPAAADNRFVVVGSGGKILGSLRAG